MPINTPLARQIDIKAKALFAITDSELLLIIVEHKAKAHPSHLFFLDFDSFLLKRTSADILFSRTEGENLICGRGRDILPPTRLYSLRYGTEWVDNSELGPSV